MFGILADIFMNERNIEAANDRQEDQQHFNSAEAIANRDWQERMSNTAVQRNKADLMAAGFNPLLAIHPGGGATTPGGATASSGIASPHSSHSIQAGMYSASQIEVNEATARKIEAETDEIRERTKNYDPQRREIEARIPTHPAQVEKIQQEIAESAVRIEKIWAETTQAASSAKHLDQQVINLQAVLPQIRAQIDNLKALTAQSAATTQEIKQRIKANLPDLEKTLGNLEAARRRMAQPGQANDAAAAESFMGQLGAYMRQINPLRGWLK